MENLDSTSEKKKVLQCGLFAKGATAPVPLKAIDITTSLAGSVASISITQKYENIEANPIETEYVFPLESDMAVNSLTIKTEDKIIEAKIEEKEKAQEKYEDAIAQGHTAYKLQYEEEQHDLLRMNAGNLLPGKEVTITIVVVKRLQIEDLSWALRLPTSYTPRYEGSHTLPAENINKQEFISNKGDVPYTWNITANIDSASPITRLISKTHDIKTQFSEDRRSAKVQLQSLNGKAGGATGEDFVLLYRNAEIGQPSIVFQESEEFPNEVAASISFFPDFKQIAEETKGPETTNADIDTDPTVSYAQKFASNDEYEEVASEFIFLVDRSGSMEGDRINKAKEALQIFIKSLPAISKFNVVSFGSSYNLLFNESLTYTEENVNKAINQVASFGADMGGTEILEAIEFILKAERDPKFPKLLFILTDGDVSRTENVLDVIRRNSQFIQVHTFGIGSGASRHLVTEAAKAGKGTSSFVADNENVSGKVIEALEKAMKPALTGAKVEFDTADLIIDQSPNQKNLPYTFKNEVFNLFLLLNKDKLKDAGEIILSFNDTRTSQTKSFKLAYDIKSSKHSLYLKGKDLFKLVARNIVKDYGQDKNEEKEKAFSLKYQVLSSQTSFIAVEKNPGAAGLGEMEVRKVPIVVHKQQIPDLQNYGLAGVPVMMFCSAPMTMARTFNISSPRSASIQPMFDMEMLESNVESLNSYSRGCSQLEADLDSLMNEREDLESESKLEEEATNIKSNNSIQANAIGYKDVLQTQKVDGAWRDAKLKEIDPAVSKYFDAIPQEVLDKVKDKNEVVAVWTTILILLFLEQRQQALESEWKLIARKGKAYLKKQGIDYDTYKTSVNF